MRTTKTSRYATSRIAHRSTHSYWIILLSFLGYMTHFSLQHAPPNILTFFYSLYTPVSQSSLLSQSPPQEDLKSLPSVLFSILPRLWIALAIYLLFKMMRRRDNAGAFALAVISAFSTSCFSRLSMEITPLSLAFFIHCALIYFLSGGGNLARSYWMGFLLGLACIFHPSFFFGTGLFLHFIFIKQSHKEALKATIMTCCTFATFFYLLPHYTLIVPEEHFVDPFTHLLYQWIGWDYGFFWSCPFLLFGLPGVFRVLKVESTLHLYLIVFFVGQLLLWATSPRYYFHPYRDMECFLFYPYLLLFLHLQWRLIWQKKHLRYPFLALVLYSGLAQGAKVFSFSLLK
jgi:hypothetical protein